MIYDISKEGLCKIALENGGDIFPLTIPFEESGGTGTMNPSVFVDNDDIYIVIRQVNYILYHSEKKEFEHKYGPLQYIHPENDLKLRTENYLAKINNISFSIDKLYKINMQLNKPDPKWDFIGLEDARLVKWNDKWYISGVRRDTTDNGQGRMELSEIKINENEVVEISRERIPAPGKDDSYCEKNWMPILDKPFHYVKWSNPTEVVEYKNKEIYSSITDESIDSMLFSLRGSSQVVPYRDGYLAIVHDVDPFSSDIGSKDAIYRHRFIYWNKDFSKRSFSKRFFFIGTDIEFNCGLAFYKNEVLITFSAQDNCSFLLKIPEKLFDELLEAEGVYA